MRTNHKFPFAMTKKSLVVYIVLQYLWDYFCFLSEEIWLESVRHVLFVRCSVYI